MSAQTNPVQLQVRGNATRDELAVVLALLARSAAATEPDADGYTRWRRSRLAALRRPRERGRQTRR